MTDNPGMSNTAQNYFDILSLEKASVREPVINCINLVISEEDNLQLT